MANLKTSKKRVLINNKKRDQNKTVKTNMRTHIKETESFIDAKDIENATSSFKKSSQVIDKAVQKKVIHKNTGNRYKKRLAEKIKEISA